MMRHTKRDYHYAVRYCRQNERRIRATRMAERLADNRSEEFWSEVRKSSKSCKNVAATVDGFSDAQNIAEIFSNKFKHLFQSVPYDENKMAQLNDSVSSQVPADYAELRNTQDNIINSSEIKDLITKLKRNKSDGYNCITTDCLIFGTDKLCVILAMLFCCILTHGYCPSEFLVGTMSPIPKGACNSQNSDKYRAITLGSNIGRLLDLLILEKEGQTSLRTDDLQLGFKKKCSTTLCTGLLKEVAAHFVQGGSTVYALFLDASKAFDCVDYFKLLSGLHQRKLNCVYLRCLINMYTNQKLRVCWNGYMSAEFPALNGVKQGGILSPTLFSTYLDGLMLMLRKSGEGCYIGPYFYGTIAYADDVCLMSPSIEGLKNMIKIAEDYSKCYRITFNGAKCQLLNFTTKKIKDNPPITVHIGAETVACKSSAVHLGHQVYSDPTQDDQDNIIKSFNRQFNMFRAKFQWVPPGVKIKLFTSYCCSFYGIQLCDLGSLQRFHVTYRKSIRLLLGLPYRTHCRLIPLIMKTLCSVHMCRKRFVKYAHACLVHDFAALRYIFRSSMGLLNSAFAKNCRHSGLLDITGNDCNNLLCDISKTCEDECSNINEKVTAMVITELLDCRYGLKETILTYLQTNELIKFMCIS